MGITDTSKVAMYKSRQRSPNVKARLAFPSPYGGISLVNSFSFDKRDETKTIQIIKIKNPSLALLHKLRIIWNEPWSLGIPQIGPAAESLRQSLLVDTDHIRFMHITSWNNILIAVCDKRVAGAIWGIQKDVDIRNLNDGEIQKICNYTRATDFLTFSHADPEGKLKSCVSVAVADDFRGYMTEEGLSVGQALVRTAFFETISDPYLTDVIAYSRPVSLKDFTRLLWGLRKLLGYRIYADKKDGSWHCRSSDNKDKKVQVTSKGIIVDDQEFAIIKDGLLEITKQGKKLIGKDQIKIELEENHYFIYPGREQLVMDAAGVAIEGENDHLVEIGPYLSTDFDGMKRFHGNKGGELRLVLPNSRRDLISLDYNIVFHFFIGAIFHELGLFEEIHKRLSGEQREAINLIAINPAKLAREIEGKRAKDIYMGFSKEKIEVMLKYFNTRENHKRENKKALIKYLRKLREQAKI